MVLVGRVIFYVADVDGLYERARAAGFAPATAPRDAEWGERYFHPDRSRWSRTQLRAASAGTRVKSAVPRVPIGLVAVPAWAPPRQDCA